MATMKPWISQDIWNVAKLVLEMGYLPNVTHTGDVNWKTIYLMQRTDGVVVGCIKFNCGEFYSCKPNRVMNHLPVWQKVRDLCKAPKPKLLLPATKGPNDVDMPKM